MSVLTLLELISHAIQGLGQAQRSAPISLLFMSLHPNHPCFWVTKRVCLYKAQLMDGDDRDMIFVLFFFLCLVVSISLLKCPTLISCTEGDEDNYEMGWQLIEDRERDEVDYDHECDN